LGNKPAQCRMKLAYLSLILYPVFFANAQPVPLAELQHFYKPVTEPIFKADSSLQFLDPIKQQMVRWQKADVFNPAAVVKDGKVYVFTRSEDNPAAALGGRTSRIGLAVSDDGIHFKTFPKPVLYPTIDSFQQYDYPGGCEDPRVVETEDGNYIMAYTSWNYKVPRLSMAVSSDLLRWQKTGPAFLKAYNGKFADMASKSASILTAMKNGRPIAIKKEGKYWMYWGELFVNLAWSENGADWFPLLDDKGELKQVMKTRTGKFDSDLVECGPPALLTDKGFMLMYNGKNAGDDRAAENLPKNTYTVGYVIFDANDLQTIVERVNQPFLRPDLPHEVTGQYKAGTCFAEGLVWFKEKWWLYYGTADSFIGVAVSGKK
jgi:predicted GH43/DUF377 family glycosyl hydrolase